MFDPELDSIKGIDLRCYAASQGYQLDRKESWAGSAVMRHANGDKIDVHRIDADVTHAGHQHFVFIGTATFAHYHSLHPGIVGMLRFDPASHQLQGNVNADIAHPDFAVVLAGVSTIHASDLILT